MGQGTGTNLRRRNASNPVACSILAKASPRLLAPQIALGKRIAGSLQRRGLLIFSILIQIDQCPLADHSPEDFFGALLAYPR